MAQGSGTKADPWALKTPPLTSDYSMYKDEKDGVDVLVCTVGKTVLSYDFRALATAFARSEHRSATPRRADAPKRPVTLVAVALQ
jgi:hypothetical protein